MISHRRIRVARRSLLPLIAFALASLGAPGTLTAAIELPPLFADHMVFQRDKPVTVWGRATAGKDVLVELFDPTQTVRVSGRTIAGPDGAWELRLPAQPASSPAAPLRLRIVAGDREILLHPVHSGDVWICSGQSNMNFLMRPHPPWSEGVLDWEDEVVAAGAPALSVFTVAPEASSLEQETVTGAWRPAIPAYVEYFPAVPYYFGAALRRDLEVPVGVVVASLGGTSIRSWIDLPGLKEIPAAVSLIAIHARRHAEHPEVIEAYRQKALPRYRKAAMARLLTPAFAAPYPEPYPNWRHQPAGLFNAMLAPLERFPVRGFTWYQGESDSSDHANYWSYLKTLVEHWRERRGDNSLPFLLVQLPNYNPVAKGSDPAVFTDVWAAMREVQEQILTLPATGMAVTADVGHPLKIHPRDKKTVAERLALTARCVAYKEKDLLHSGPRPTGMQVKDAAARIDFSHTGSGLLLDFTRASGRGRAFEIAGAGREFHPASPRIDREQIVLTSEQVGAPVHVRYAYDNDPRLILYNKEGLPAPPFRISLPVKELGRIDFAESSTAAVTAEWIRPLFLLPGPGVRATGFNTNRGTPPPSFFVRTTSTPDTQATAIADGHFVELSLAAEADHLLDLRRAELRFDIARSTTTGSFGFAVRWSRDDFASDLTAKTIQTSNEEFAPVIVPLGGHELSDTPTVIRIYFWDNLDDSLRFFCLDSFRILGGIQ